MPPCGMRTYPTMRRPSSPRRSASVMANSRLNRSESKRRARSPVLFPTYHPPPFFSTTFPLPARNYLCFLWHSGFARKFSTAVLCFHRHSRVGRSFLKNSFLLPSRPLRWPLECGSLLPLFFAGSLLPAAPRASSTRKSGSKLPHSKALRARKLLWVKSPKVHSPLPVAGRANLRAFPPAWHFLAIGLGRAVALPHRVLSRAWTPTQPQLTILAYLVAPVKRQEVPKNRDWPIQGVPDVVEKPTVASRG